VSAAAYFLRGRQFEWPAERWEPIVFVTLSLVLILIATAIFIHIVFTLIAVVFIVISVIIPWPCLRQVGQPFAPTMSV
jgi:hypothetical protein